MDEDRSLDESFEKNVVEFIKNVEQHPVVWDRSYNSTCTNKVFLEERAEAWQLICRKYDNDFDSKSKRERNEIETFLKRKWRNIRDCYLRELRDIARNSRADHVYKRRKKLYIYFNNLRFIGDLTPDEKNKIKSAEEEDGDFSYVEDALVEHYASEEEILQTLINEGDPANEGEHIIIEQVSSLPTQRKRKAVMSASYESQNFSENSSSSKKKIVKRVRNTSHLHDPSADLNCSADEQTHEKTEHFFDLEAYSSSRPPNAERAAQELPNSRRISSFEIDSDEDRLFMLSMVPDMKLVPKHMKLDMKADILNVIRNYVKKTHEKDKSS